MVREQYSGNFISIELFHQTTNQVVIVKFDGCSKNGGYMERSKCKDLIP